MRELLTLLVHDPAIVTDALVAAIAHEIRHRSAVDDERADRRARRLRTPVLGFWAHGRSVQSVGGALKFSNAAAMRASC